MLGLVPRPVHAVLDYVWSLLFGLTGPALLGFSGNRMARNTVLALTVTEIGALLLSQSDPRGK